MAIHEHCALLRAEIAHIDGRIAVSREMEVRSARMWKILDREVPLRAIARLVLSGAGRCGCTGEPLCEMCKCRDRALKERAKLEARRDDLASTLAALAARAERAERAGRA